MDPCLKYIRVGHLVGMHWPNRDEWRAFYSLGTSPFLTLWDDAREYGSYKKSVSYNQKLGLTVVAGETSELTRLGHAPWVLI